MKSKFKKLVLGIMVLSCIALLFGCSNSVSKSPAKEYSNKLNTFKISVAGEWIVEENTNENNITLDNEDKSLTITIQGFSKSFEAMDQIKDVDTFIALKEKTVLAKLIEMGEVSEIENVKIDGVKAAKANEIVAEQNGVVAKCYNVYIETEKAFYSATITGVEELYDKNIESLKEALKTFKEVE
ncbi:hypothetical protein [Anaerophilus nitritogenes]|uniref:hypothetical protein n=1 Tax=Anaerophilus nitritogenes TaxID=2498136 RepID=UPI00101DF045|nr:hypothetical protein [Anaerophilus nitritogenes]